MFDFLHPKLSPKVKTTTACMDGYEAENLVSTNYLIKSRGFMAYTSIKPPVDICFDLICPVNIHYLHINATNGSQKSSGIEVFIKNDKNIQVSVGQAIFEERGVVFCNSRFYSKTNPPPNSHNMYLAFFKSNTFRHFTNAIEVVVRITRTVRTSVPCLGKVEVWGKVSKISSQYTNSSIESLLNENLLKKKTVEETVVSSNEIVSSSLEIPEEFKDALTYEIMSIPMTLPSGHTVDQITLEKCINNDHSYGRAATDPFTGVKFTDTRKPIINAALKSRIDMFLVQNSNRKEVATVQRTVGRRPVKRISETYTMNNKKMKINPYNGENDTITSNNKVGGDNAEDSLMDRINKVMNSSNFVRFTGNALNEEEQVKQKFCGLCKVKENLFELPCLHIFCRSCLVELCKNAFCNICKCAFKRSDPKKIHN